MATMETVIDPKKETVEVVKYDYFNGDFSDYRKIIEAQILTFVRLYENGDGVYLEKMGPTTVESGKDYDRFVSVDDSTSWHTSLAWS